MVSRLNTRSSTGILRALSMRLGPGDVVREEVRFGGPHRFGEIVQMIAGVFQTLGVAVFTVSLSQSRTQLPLAIHDFLSKIVLPLNDEIPGCFDWFRHRNLRIDQYGPQRQWSRGPNFGRIGSRAGGFKSDPRMRVYKGASLERRLH